MDTPWGWSHQHQNLTDSIITVSTAHHGGIGVSRHRIDQLPADLAAYITSHGNAHHSRTYIWFEEDQEWIIPFFVFTDEIRQHGAIDPEKFEENLTLARTWIERAYPELPALVKRASLTDISDPFAGW